jgi:hypothetical protein
MRPVALKGISRKYVTSRFDINNSIIFIFKMNTIFRDAIFYISLEFNRRFGGIYFLIFLGKIVGKRIQQISGSLSSIFVLHLHNRYILRLRTVLP